MAWNGAEAHRQSRQTLALIRAALVQRASRSLPTGDAALVWREQLEQAADELTYIVNERRFDLQLRQDARELRDDVRKALERITRSIEKHAQAMTAQEPQQAITPARRSAKPTPVANDESEMPDRHVAMTSPMALAVLQEIVQQGPEVRMERLNSVQAEARLAIVLEHIKRATAIREATSVAYELQKDALRLLVARIDEQTALERHLGDLRRQAQMPRRVRRRADLLETEAQVERFLDDTRQKHAARQSVDLTTLGRVQLEQRHAVVLWQIESLDDIGLNGQISDESKDVARRITAVLKTEANRLQQRIKEMRQVYGKRAKPKSVPKRDERDEHPALPPPQPTLDLVAATTPPMQKLPWRIFGERTPTLPEIKTHYRLFPPKSFGREPIFDFDRLDYLYTFHPDKVYKGLDEFDGYVVLYFEQRELAVFECPKVGHALYIVRGSWQIAARKSKAALREDRSGAIRRIVHEGAWRGRVRQVLEAILEQPQEIWIIDPWSHVSSDEEHEPSEKS